MYLVSKETPSGTIDVVNKTFTLSKTVKYVDDIFVDGIIYTDYSLSRQILTLDDAPTATIEVDYWVNSPKAT